MLIQRTQEKNYAEGKKMAVREADLKGGYLKGDNLV